MNATPLMTVKDVAAKLHMAERTVYTLLASGALPSYKVAGSRRVDEDDVDRYLQAHKANVL